MKKKIKKIRNFFRIINIHIKDFFKEIKYCGFYNESSYKVPWRILLLSHSIEKGLSIPEKRKNFGEDKAKDLCKYLKLYNKKEDYVYNEGKSVINSYIKYRKENELSYKEFQVEDDIEDKLQGGINTITKNEVEYNFKEFEKLCNIRHSVREYSDEYVTIEKIKEAIKIASKAPSACNRQMTKVYCSNKPQVNKELAKIIPGNTGFKDEHATYLFLTSDYFAFDYFELEQWYLNGGIFIAYLQLAFAAKQIGSCIYQWPKDKKKEKKVKEILNIPKNEIIVSVLGVGNYKEKFSVLKAKRKEIKDIFICE